MDRGLNLVLQAGPANARLTRFLFVTPCFCVTPPRWSHCLPRHRHRMPRCDNTTPFASIWLGLGLALTSIFGRYRLTLKNVCRARHTTTALTRTGNSAALHCQSVMRHYSRCFFTLIYQTKWRKKFAYIFSRHFFYSMQNL